MKKILMAFALVLICNCAFAYDSNASVTAGQMQEIIASMNTTLLAEMRMSIQELRSQPVPLDTTTLQTLDRLDGKLTALEQKFSLFEDRFVALKNELSDKIDISATLTSTTIESKTNARIDASTAAINKYTRDMTNPIRINLPNFALWLMVTSAFMLIAGLRMKGAIKSAKAEEKGSEK